MDVRSRVPDFVRCPRLTKFAPAPMNESTVIALLLPDVPPVMANLVLALVCPVVTIRKPVAPYVFPLPTPGKTLSESCVNDDQVQVPGWAREKDAAENISSLS